MNTRSDPRQSPILVGQETKTPLDLVTNRLLFTFPLNNEQIKFLNTVIYDDGIFYINYWSLTHTFFAMIWAVFMIYDPSRFTIIRYLILHTVFEIWELWAGGYFDGSFDLTVVELLDGVMDTLFGLFGIILVLCFFGKTILWN